MSERLTDEQLREVASYPYGAPEEAVEMAAELLVLRAENERLQDRIAELQAEVGYTDSILAVENERLREALKVARSVVELTHAGEVLPIIDAALSGEVRTK